MRAEREAGRTCFELCNRHRERQGLSELRWCATLHAAAEGRARAMAGGAMLEPAGATENLAVVEAGGRQPVELQVANGWLLSGPHRARVEGAFARGAVGVARAEVPARYFFSQLLSK